MFRSYVSLLLVLLLSLMLISCKDTTQQAQKPADKKEATQKPEQPQAPKTDAGVALKQFAQLITAKSQPESLKVNEKVTFPVTVQNAGKETWPSSGGKPVHLSYRWLDSTGKIMKEGSRAVLPKDLKPGESVTLDMTVTALDKPGKYTLRLDMVQETVAWFSGAGGAKPLEFPVVIK